MQRQAKILVVDDDPDIREAISAVLEAHSYQVIVACDGEEGLGKLK
jgi:DNA-binding response OmpR family regulator